MMFRSRKNLHRKALNKCTCTNLCDPIRYNSIQQCFPNEPLSGYGMGFQASILQSLTFLRTIPLLLQCELVNKSTNKSGRHIGFSLPADVRWGSFVTHSTDVCGEAILACVAWRFWLGALSNKGGRRQRNREEIGAGVT